MGNVYLGYLKETISQPIDPKEKVRWEINHEKKFGFIYSLVHKVMF